MDRSVRDLHARAVQEYNAGHASRAYSLLNRAHDLLGGTGGRQPELLARVLISLALSESELFGPAAGMRRLDEAAAVAGERADPALDVLILSQRGALSLRSGDLEAALRHYVDARPLSHHAEDYDRAIILANIGSLHLFRGELVPARRALLEAIEFCADHGIVVEEAKARHNLGYVDFLAGDLPGALRAMEVAGRVTTDLPRGIPLLDRARVLAESGLHLEADAALTEASAIFRRDRLLQDLAETELERARCALLASDLRTARRWASSARDRFRRRGNQQWRRAAELTLLQGDLAVGRPPTRLVGPALRLQAEFAAEGLVSQARTASLIAAEALRRAGRQEQARDVLERSGTPTAREPVAARLHAREVRARILRDAGEPAAAARLVRAGLRELALHQSSFGSIDLRAASAVHGRGLAELDVALALETRRAAAVFASAERARAVSARLPTIQPPQDATAAELLADLRRTVEALRATEQDATSSAPLLRRRRELERQIAARRWTLAGTGDVGRVARLTDVRAALRSDEALVSYVQVSGALHAVVVGDGRLRLCELGPSRQVVELARRVRADLDVLAYPHLPGPLAGAVRSSLLRSLAHVDDVLVRPLRLGGRRLVISSTGSLGQLPWGALPSLRGVPVVVAPSATAWLCAATAPGQGGEVVALAGPDLGRGVEEVAGVAAAHPGALALTGAAADGEAFTAALGKARILHVAAHGLHQTENPLFSSVRLADGVLFAHELDRTARTPDHVVLSACELGLATVRPGDEALGLTSVLLHLGTRSVVAGVARVGDEVAERTMVDYHRALAAGADSAAALARALSGAELPPPFVCFGAAWSPA